MPFLLRNKIGVGRLFVTRRATTQFFLLLLSLNLLSAGENSATNDWTTTAQYYKDYQKASLAGSPMIKFGIDESLKVYTFPESPTYSSIQFYYQGIRSQVWNASDRFSIFPNFPNPGNYTVVLDRKLSTWKNFSSNCVYYKGGEEPSNQVVAYTRGLDRFPNSWYCNWSNYYSFLLKREFRRGDPPPLADSIELSFDQESISFHVSNFDFFSGSDLFWLIYKNGVLFSEDEKVSSEFRQIDPGDEDGIFLAMIAARIDGNLILVSQLSASSYSPAANWEIIPPESSGRNSFREINRLLNH